MRLSGSYLPFGVMWDENLGEKVGPQAVRPHLELVVPCQTGAARRVAAAGAVKEDVKPSVIYGGRFRGL